MKPIWKYIVVGILCFGIGSLSTYFFMAQKSPPKPKGNTLMTGAPQPLFPSPFGDEDNDPFKAMAKMEEEMLSQLQDDRSGGFAFSQDTDIQQREDNKFVYYTIQLKDINRESLKVNIENGQVNLTANIEKKSNSRNGSNTMVSIFERSFPLPGNIDSDKLEISQEKEKIILKFPKLPN